jgi:hypothetical protein
VNYLLGGSHRPWLVCTLGAINQWRSTKDCAARNGCGGTLDESNWESFALSSVGEPTPARTAGVAGLTPTIAELTQAIEQEVEKPRSADCQGCQSRA